MTHETNPFFEAKQKALRRLNRRECSAGDISQYLKRHGFASEIIGQVVQELVEKKYINDETYTRIVVREQTLRGKGPQWIRMKLREKGIIAERGTIETLMRDAADTTELA